MYLLARVLRGGGSIGGRYTETGYKYFDSDNAIIKRIANEYSKGDKIKVAKQKYHISITPYIGYRVNGNSDIYVIGGMKMVATKYLGFKNKRTFHPVLGAGTRYTFSNNVFIKFEGVYVFSKKQKIPGELTLKDGNATYKVNTKTTVKHGEYTLKLGVGCKL